MGRTNDAVFHAAEFEIFGKRPRTTAKGGGGRRGALKVPESFQVPLGNVCEIQAFEVVAEILSRTTICQRMEHLHTWRRRVVCTVGFYLEHISAIHEAGWCDPAEVAVTTAAAVSGASPGDTGCWDRLHRDSERLFFSSRQYCASNLPFWAGLPASLLQSSCPAKTRFFG